jgi:hypothetical protein
VSQKVDEVAKIDPVVISSNSSSSSNSSNSSSSSVLAPHSNNIIMLLLSRCMWPPMRMRALVIRARLQRLHAAVMLQCCFRAKRARTSCKRLAESLPPALYRSQRCLAAVKLLQRTFISHRVKSRVDFCPTIPTIVLTSLHRLDAPLRACSSAGQPVLKALLESAAPLRRSVRSAQVPDKAQHSKCA